MICDLLTVVDGVKLLERNGYKRPAIPKEPAELAMAYLEQLNDLPAEIVTEGFSRFVREGESTYWPRPGQIRKLALVVRRERPAAAAKDLKGRYMAWENRGWRSEDGTEITGCPVCDVLPANEMPEPSHVAKHPVSPIYRVNHDRQRHREAGVPSLG